MAHQIGSVWLVSHSVTMKSHDREEVVSSEDADMGHCGSVLNQPHMQIKKSNDHV